MSVSKKIAVLVYALSTVSFCIAIAFIMLSSTGGGADPLLRWLLGLLCAPLVLLPLCIPNKRVHFGVRIVSLASLLIYVSVVVTNWPYRIAFSTQKSALAEYAKRVRSGEVATGRGARRVGSFFVLSVQMTHEGNVGFQLTGGPGGGVFLVHTKPDCTWVWYNTNWEENLGDGWYRVFED